MCNIPPVCIDIVRLHIRTRIYIYVSILCIRTFSFRGNIQCIVACDYSICKDYAVVLLQFPRQCLYMISACVPVIIPFARIMNSCYYIGFGFGFGFIFGFGFRIRVVCKSRTRMVTNQVTKNRSFRDRIRIRIPNPSGM